MVVLLSLAALSACSGSVDSGTGGTSTTSSSGGSSACDDYAAKAQGCCDKLTDAADKTSCEASLKNIHDQGNEAACQVALDVLGTACD